VSAASDFQTAGSSGDAFPERCRTAFIDPASQVSGAVYGKGSSPHERRFEFIPLWGGSSSCCTPCGASIAAVAPQWVVEEVPWGEGKRTLARAYMLFLTRWARRLSWKETAEAFRTSWDKIFDAVEHVVTWGLEHLTLGQIDAIGVDEIQYSKGHKYLELVYQLDLGVTRLLWVGKERTVESFQGFFNTIGEEITSKIVFICSDMWEPYLKVIREKCSEALHILDRFHIVAKMNKALDEVRAGESRRMASEGRLAARLSWKEMAEAFRTSWDKVFDAAEHVVSHMRETV
jgi:transposase